MFLILSTPWKKTEFSMNTLQKDFKRRQNRTQDHLDERNISSSSQGDAIHLRTIPNDTNKELEM